LNPKPESNRAGGCPRQVINGVITTESGDDLLIYDTSRHHIHHLNPVASAIWRACDGRRDTSSLACAASERLGTDVSEESVQLALRALAAANLVAGVESSEPQPALGTRRRLIRRAMVVASTPIVISMSAPAAVASSSTATAMCDKYCEADSWCSGCCSKCNSGFTGYNHIHSWACYNPNRWDDPSNPYRC